MGNAYLAMAGGGGSFNKLVVLKVLKPEFAEDPEFLAMFRDEARVAANLNHPNVVQTHEFGVEAGHFYIAMDFVDGQTLRGVRRRLHERKVPFLGADLRVLRDVLEGLHHAHELAEHDGTPLDLVHRDVSPHNVMVGYDGHARLLDFGIAKVTGAAHQTHTAVLKGKVGYMAPEQARSDALDRRADIFSVGVMMWEAVAGTRMWGELTDVQVVARLMNREIPPLPVAVDGAAVPQALRALVHKATAADRDARYDSARALALDLDAYLDTLPRSETGVRALAELVSHHFEVEREKRRRVVDEAIRQIREAATSDEHPVLLGLTASGSEPSTAGPAIGLLHATASPTSQPSLSPLDASHTLTPSHSQPSPPHRGRPSNPGLDAFAQPLLAGRIEAGAPAAPQRAAWMVGLGGGGIAALLLVVGLVGLSAKSAQSTPAAAPTATVAAPVAAPEVGLELVVLAGTSKASVTIDGREIALGRELRTPRDTLEHTLLVTAPGHKAHTAAVRFDRDQRLTITLEPLPSDPPDAGAIAGRKPKVGGAAAPTGPKRPDRPIIEELK